MHKIENIKYQSLGCYGQCPVFDIEINKSQNAIFIAKYFNFLGENSSEITGVFETTISEITYREITDLLNNIDFTELEDKYSVEWTDDQNSIFEITYDSNKIKRINDYGMAGTDGLKKIHKFMSELRLNQKWKKIK
jgi:hypothetical protein